MKYFVIDYIRGDSGDDFAFDISESVLQTAKNVISTTYIVIREIITKSKMMQTIEVSKNMMFEFFKSLIKRIIIIRSYS